MAVKKAPVAPKPDPLLKARRVLSTTYLVSKVGMLGLTATNLQKLMVENPELPRKVVENFDKLSSATHVRDVILSGADASLELEFNGITVTDEQQAALKVLGPLLVSLSALTPAYPWLNPSETFEEFFTLTSTVIMRNRYTFRVSTAKTVWGKASRYWAGVTKSTPRETYENVGNNEGYKYIRYTKEHVGIGCQNIPRAQVEYLARYYGWPIPSISE